MNLLLRERRLKVNILLSLKSQVIKDALSELLAKENDGDVIIKDTMEPGSYGCRPDVIIVDNGNISQEFLAKWPESKFLLLDTGLRQDDVVTLILMYKLQGVIAIDADIVLMKKALKLVNEGQIWIDHKHMKALICKAGITSATNKVTNVSKREHDILDLIVKGKKNKEIASQLFMSEQTVKAHITRIFKKFNVVSRTQLVSQILNAS